MLELKFTGVNLKAVHQEIFDFLDATLPDWPVVSNIGKQPVDLDNRHPHGNTPVPQTRSEDAPDPAEDTDSSDPVSYDECLVALKAYMKEHGKAKAVAVLTKYNVDRLSELKEFGAIYGDLANG